MHSVTRLPIFRATKTDACAPTKRQLGTDSSSLQGSLKGDGLHFEIPVKVT